MSLILSDFPRAQPQGNSNDSGTYFTVYPELSPYTDIIPFPNNDSAVAVAAVPVFSFGLDFLLFDFWNIFVTL